MESLCECGCGRPTTIIKANDATRGLVKGASRRFVNGHNRIRPRIDDKDYVIEESGYATPCWIWQGARNNKGYGQLTMRGRHLQAHRAMWEQERGPIPPGLQIDHLCGNPPCCNPDHLEPVTNLVNVHRSRRTRISDEDVAAIRAAREAGELLATIASRFGVSTSHVCAIVNDQVRRAAISP